MHKKAFQVVNQSSSVNTSKWKDVIDLYIEPANALLSSLRLMHGHWLLIRYVTAWDSFFLFVKIFYFLGFRIHYLKKLGVNVQKVKSIRLQNVLRMFRTIPQGYSYVRTEHLPWVTVKSIGLILYSAPLQFERPNIVIVTPSFIANNQIPSFWSYMTLAI